MKAKTTTEGCWFKGKFIPVWGGLYDGTSVEFFRGALPGISRTLKCDDSASVCVEQINKDMAKVYRIRKLTPRECFRLMGASDEDISKIQNYPLVWDGTDFVAPEGMTPKELKAETISESQQYKMAGNSIVVPVLEGIFTQMFRKDSDALF